MDKPGYWAVIPATVRYDPDLPPNAKILYGEITALSNAKGYCCARNAYFAELFGLGEKSVSRLIAQLAKGGYLRVEVIRDEKNEVVERRAIPIYGAGDVCPPPLKIEDTPPRRIGETPPPKNEEKNNTSIEYIPPIVPPEGDGAPKPRRRRTRANPGAPEWKPERFARFWRCYPRGEAKQRAVQAWDRLKPDDALIDRMARALQRQLRRPDWREGVGVPYASTWLNQARWEDEERAGPGASASPPRAPRPFHFETVDGEEVVVYDD